MSSAPLLPAEPQGGVGKLKINSEIAKDGKGTLTGMWKKKEETTVKASDAPEEINLVDEAPEDVPAGGDAAQVTPAPATKPSEPAQPAEKDSEMEVDAPESEQPAPASETADDQVGNYLN